MGVLSHIVKPPPDANDIERVEENLRRAIEARGIPISDAALRNVARRVTTQLIELDGQKSSDADALDQNNFAEAALLQEHIATKQLAMSKSMNAEAADAFFDAAVLHIGGDLNKSIVMLEKAINIDPSIVQ